MPMTPVLRTVLLGSRRAQVVDNPTDWLLSDFTWRDAGFWVDSAYWLEEEVDYIISDDATWASVFALGPVVLAGKTIGVMAGNYTSKTIANFNPASLVTVIGLDPLSRPIIEKLVLDGSSNITFERLDIRNSDWTNTNGLNHAAVLLSNTIANITFKWTAFRGNYRGVIQGIDPTATLPEYACITCDVVGGAISLPLTITRPFVGDLLADGTYDLDFSAAGGTGATGTMTVSGGNIVSTNLTAGGSGYNTNAHPTRRVTWVGQRRMLDWMPWGIRSTSPCTIDVFSVYDCTFSTFANAYKPSGNTALVTLEGNHFEKIYMDYMSMGQTSPSNPYPCIIRWNFGTLPFSSPGDAGDPHSDFVQIFADDIVSGGVLTTDWEGVVIEGNIFVNGTCRGSVQGHIIADMPSGISYAGLRFAYNFIASSVQSLGVAVVNPKDCYLMNNALVRWDTTDPANTSPAQIRFPGIQDDPGGGYYAYGRSVVGNNIYEQLSANGWSTPTVNSSKYPNVELGTVGATIPYGDVFANHTGPRTTIAEIVAAYAPKALYAGKGPFANVLLCDHVNRTINRDLEPTYVYFDSLNAQSLNTLVTSEWSRSIGGPTSRSISVSNGEYRIADDSAGLNATAWTSSPGTLTIGKFVQVRHTTSGSGSTSVVTTLTIGSDTATFTSTTVSTASFVFVDNGGTARSRIETLALESGIRRVALAIRFKVDTLAISNIFADATASGCRLWLPTTTTIRGQFGASNRANLRPTFTVENTTPRTHFITLDFTNTTANNGAKWATDLDGVLLDGTSPGTGGTFDTRSVAGSGSDYGSASLATTGTSSLFGGAGHLGLFGESDGGGVLFDGSIAFFWMDWGDHTYALPDITDSAVRNKFSADLIGANGGGPFLPTVRTPKLYFTGSVDNWNAGFANLGSLVVNLTKQAGTYSA